MTENKEFDQKLSKELMGIQSLDELSKLAGEITPEGQQLLDSIDFNASPTPEELEALGPDFTQRVIELTKQRIQESESQR